MDKKYISFLDINNNYNLKRLEDLESMESNYDIYSKKINYFITFNGKDYRVSNNTFDNIRNYLKENNEYCDNLDHN